MVTKGKKVRKRRKKKNKKRKTRSPTADEAAGSSQVNNTNAGRFSRAREDVPFWFNTHLPSQLFDDDL